MKKTILTIFICGFISLGLTGCRTNKNEFNNEKESNIEIVEKGVSLSIKENTLTNSSATLILKNESNVNVIYGNPYEIEIKKDGKWYKIDAELNFNSPAFSLNSQETKEIKLDWENGYGKLTSGDYRIIKDISIEKEDGTFDNFYVAVEFTIE